MGYAIFAARSNPRWWLVPLDFGGACVRSGFEMFQPVSRLASVAKTGMQLATGMAEAKAASGVPDLTRHRSAASRTTWPGSPSR